MIYDPPRAAGRIFTFVRGCGFGGQERTVEGKDLGQKDKLRRSGSLVEQFRNHSAKLRRSDSLVAPEERQPGDTAEAM